MVAGGVNTCEGPVNAPGFQVYVVAPLAVNVVELPEQIPKSPLMFTVGVVVTVMLVVRVEAQVPLKPVSV